VDLGCETNFWLSPVRIGPFFRFEDIHPANRLRTSPVVALGGYSRQESVTAPNRLLLLCQLKEEVSQDEGRLFSSVESNIVSG
jgi:hypothetical protein